jgi:hypothetical protein
MSANEGRTSAKIYQFPLRGRLAETEARANPVEQTLAWNYKAAVGSSWYHEAAVEEAKQDRER